MNLDSDTEAPVLRFKDDEGEEYPEWEAGSLEDFVKFSKGRGISRADVTEEGSCKCIRYGELYTLYKETISVIYSRTNAPISELVLSQKYDVVMPSSGETALDIVSASCVLAGGVALGGDVNILRSQQNGIFLAYYLNSKRREIARYAQGISVIHLYAVHLKRVDIALPCIQEQQKIANFLSSVDTRIEQLEKKKALLEQYKKGLMQKLFSQEIRLKDDQGEEYPEWEFCRFTELFNVVPTKKFQIMKSDILPEGKYKVVDQGKEMIAGFSNAKNKLLPVIDGVIIYGDHTTVVKFVDFDFIVGADGTKILSTSDCRCIRYLYYCVEFHNITAEGYKRHFSIIKDITLPVPTKIEQQKIANLLSSVDRKIELIKEQINQTRGFKKGLLQQMFV